MSGSDLKSGLTLPAKHCAAFSISAQSAQLMSGPVTGSLRRSICPLITQHYVAIGPLVSQMVYCVIHQADSTEEEPLSLVSDFWKISACMHPCTRM